MKIYAITLIIFLGTLVRAQNADKILAEGQFLFRLEKGSWYGTDDMLARFPNKRDSIGGYLSYETENNTINTIFFNRYEPHKLLLRYEFDSIPKPNPIAIDSLNPIATNEEKELIDLRTEGLKILMNEEDDFFLFYENTSPNIIPVITKKDRKVYILTGPQYGGMVLIGNDYELTFDKKNKLKEKKKLHNSLLQFFYTSDDPDNKLETTMHSHVITDAITPTDICTLLLYKDFLEWDQHYVMSEKYVSIFDLKKEKLFIMKREAWEKVMNHVDKVKDKKNEAEK